MSQHHEVAGHVTTRSLRQMKVDGEKIASLTAYDASFARVLDEAGIDFILVGDSLGMVVQGHTTTIPVTMDEMVYHTRLVSRGIKRALLMADMPFMSYASGEACLRNAARLMKEGGAEMVKLESGATQFEIVEFLAQHDIAVCAHFGLKPQSVHKTGGFRVQGRQKDAAERIQRLKAPLLVVHGSADQLIAPDLGRALFDRAPGPKRFVLVEGGSHHNSNAVGQEQVRAAMAELFGLPAVLAASRE